MNCPHCNKEVSPEWKLCPFCGFAPKKCSNPECQPRWLPQEAKFCPECGKPLEGTSILPITKVKEENRSVSIGDILCTDNTTVPSSAWPVVGKTAMGVVFYVDDTGEHGWAVHLKDQGDYLWSSRGEESEVYGLRKCNSLVAALADEDGYANTKGIRAEGYAFEYPAAYAVDFGQGWYLPALGQLKVLFNRRNAINTILELVDGMSLGAGWYWSSTQRDKHYAWYVFYPGGVNNGLKTGTIGRVRSVRAF